MNGIIGHGGDQIVKNRKIQEGHEIEENTKTHRVGFKLVPAGAIVSCIPSPEEALRRSL